MRGSGQKTARKTAPPRASGDRRRFEPSAPVPTEVNGDGVEVNGDGVAVNEEQAQFGRLVAFRRQRLGMSQEELAAQMGIGLDGVVRIEQGEAPSPEMSGRLAHALRDEPPSGLARWSLPVGGLSLEAARSRLRRDGVPDWLNVEAARSRLRRDGLPAWLSWEAIRRRLRFDAAPTLPSFDGVRTRLRALGGRRLAGGIAIAAVLLLLLVALVGPFGNDGEISNLDSPSAALSPLADYSATLGAAARAEARQERLAAERLAAKRAAAAAAERRREAKAAAAARREQEESEVASTPESPAPVFVPAPSGGGGGSGGGSSAPAPKPDAGHALTPEG